MKILIVNPNTTLSMTEKIGESGFQWLGAWYVADYKEAEEKEDQAETHLCRGKKIRGVVRRTRLSVHLRLSKKHKKTVPN